MRQKRTRGPRDIYPYRVLPGVPSRTVTEAPPYEFANVGGHLVLIGNLRYGDDSMDVQFGTPKSLEDITLADVQQHPIWVWVWEAGLEEQAEDETWQCPVTNTTDVTADMVEPIISLRIKGTELIASASYDPEREDLEGISVWQGGAWGSLRDTQLEAPVTLVAIPTIGGQAGVEFTCEDFERDQAHRVGAS